MRDEIKSAFMLFSNGSNGIDMYVYICYACFPFGNSTRVLRNRKLLKSAFMYVINSFSYVLLETRCKECERDFMYSTLQMTPHEPLQGEDRTPEGRKLFRFQSSYYYTQFLLGRQKEHAVRVDASKQITTFCIIPSAVINTKWPSYNTECNEGINFRLTYCFLLKIASNDAIRCIGLYYIQLKRTFGEVIPVYMKQGIILCFL